MADIENRLIHISSPIKATELEKITIINYNLLMKIIDLCFEKRRKKMNKINKVLLIYAGACNIYEMEILSLNLHFIENNVMTHSLSLLLAPLTCSLAHNKWSAIVAFVFDSVHEPSCIWKMQISRNNDTVSFAFYLFIMHNSSDRSTDKTV